jgi:transcriptional regulator with XRE-family HTH domain
MKLRPFRAAVRLSAPHQSGIRFSAVASASGNADEPPGSRPSPSVRAVLATANPTIRQRQLGMRLRALRTSRGMTVDDVSRVLLCSAAKISRMETGARQAGLRDVRDLCRLYGVDDAMTEELMTLAKQAREPSWWSQYKDLQLEPFIGFEQEAVAITTYGMYYVPPLLQTEQYARSLIRAIQRKMDPEILEQRVEARLRRQQILHRPDPPRYRALIDEAVLYRQIGGKAVLAEQLDKVLAAMAGDNASVQVIPFTAGAHASADSNFDLLEFREDSGQHSVVFVESLISNLYQERPAEVARYREAIEYLRESALSLPESAALISRIRHTYAD